MLGKEQHIKGLAMAYFTDNFVQFRNGQGEYRRGAVAPVELVSQEDLALFWSEVQEIEDVELERRQ